MPGLCIFSGLFCNGSNLKNRLQEDTGFKLFTDDDLTALAAGSSELSERRIRRAFLPETSVFNRFTHEKEYALACLKLALAQLAREEDFMVFGYSGMLIPRAVSHVLHACLTADPQFRLERAESRCSRPEDPPAELIRRDTRACSAWTATLFSIPDPWHPDLHDIVIPMDKTDPSNASRLIMEALDKPPVLPTEKSRQAAADFLLGARVEADLLKAGHNVGVRVEKTTAVLTITRPVLMPERLETELRGIAGRIQGISGVDILVDPSPGPGAYYRRHSPETPSRVLLVDDEREFVETLSERLQMREMGSAVALDGKSALEMVRNDAPDLMIIDLKMPGIDGIRVLSEVKRTRPEIQVIVLTGHGSEQDRKTCMDMGAFAYFQKPVDIDTLSDTLKQAHLKSGSR